MKKEFRLTILLFMFFACMGFADLVYLENGKTIEGEVISETEEKVTVRLPMGSQGDIVYTLEKSKITKIEKAPVSYDFLAEGYLKEKNELNTAGFSFGNILKKVLEAINGDKENVREVNLTGSGKRIKAYIASSGFIGVIANLLLGVLAVCTFNTFRKDTEVFASGIEKMTVAGIFGKWLFFSVSLMFIHLQRFGSFDLIGSGILSIFFLAVICYETLKLFVLLFLRQKFKEFLSGGKFINVMIFKVPIACEFTLFAYLLLMSVFMVLI